MGVAAATAVLRCVSRRRVPQHLPGHSATPDLEKMRETTMGRDVTSPGEGLAGSFQEEQVRHSITYQPIEWMTFRMTTPNVSNNQSSVAMSSLSGS
ncbi:hypothetical protein MPTK1_1g14170 [Marchantia polymorpha subsp. ruderalis]|uniref:Uncharacterized protein n=2 Tax=Marchantia polymorpha TaxID=3197 RepID=A0AAF6AQ05_MARPO|nr:hypothetical protein MARPO_0019s0187 [Marchantia polymorpha]BBM98525.1 hypothetical protein Mp_1g14170 [Marchantia polymorpha subsp. ruderalis]|eukprot:PTQ44796.1 hypothetical protein MARPO_0019s0187 [Marchantia polymorpha]